MKICEVHGLFMGVFSGTSVTEYVVAITFGMIEDSQTLTDKKNVAVKGSQYLGRIISERSLLSKRKM